jgi:hypothetical protein
MIVFIEFRKHHLTVANRTETQASAVYYLLAG